MDISEQLRMRNLNRQSNDMNNLGPDRSAPQVSFTAINHDHGSVLPTPEPTHPLSQAMASTDPPQMQSGPYAESWRHHSTSWHQTHSSTVQAYLTPGSVLDPESTRALAHEQIVMDDSENFWDKLQKDELFRFGATGDLSLFSTGQSEVSVADLPFDATLYIPIMGGSSYQLLQQTGDDQTQTRCRQIQKAVGGERSSSPQK